MGRNGSVIHEKTQEMWRMASQDSFGAKSTLDVDGKSYEIFRLDKVVGDGLDVASLPFSLKVLLGHHGRRHQGARGVGRDR